MTLFMRRWSEKHLINVGGRCCELFYLQVSRARQKLHLPARGRSRVAVAAVCDSAKEDAASTLEVAPEI